MPSLWPSGCSANIRSCPTSWTGRDKLAARRSGQTELHAFDSWIMHCYHCAPTSWPFQASGISHNQTMQPGRPPTPWHLNIIDKQYLNNWWDPSKVDPKGKRSYRGAAPISPGHARTPGFSLALDSSNPLPVPASPIAHVGDPPPRRSGSESGELSWHPRPSLSGME